MKMKALKLIICALAVLSGPFYVRGMEDFTMPKEDIKGVTKLLNMAHSRTIKTFVYGGMLLTSPLFWDVVATAITTISSPFATVSYYATNPATATLVPLLLNPFINYVIKPLPNNLKNKIWNEPGLLKNIFLKNYTCISDRKGHECSRFMFNPSEYVKDSNERDSMKQATGMAHVMRGRYRVRNNPIAAAIASAQVFLTFYAIYSTLKTQSLDNRTKGLTALISLYAIIGQLHEFTNIKYFSKQEAEGSPAGLLDKMKHW
ncbi:MAG TPA: hypothetical protein VL201_04135 [Patescibacteria group bacterium]|jgi:hypothetical protein|nr:hypothetical protein [Patescibacteria group bacterium]